MATPKKAYKSVAEILEARQKELLEAWPANIIALPGTRRLKLMTEGQGV